jgi:hypothetical protein
LEDGKVFPLDSVLIVNKDQEYYLWNSPERNFCLISSDEVRVYRNYSHVVRLIDSNSSHLDGWKGASVIFSSPGFEPMKKFLKVYPKKWIMPVWSLEELQVLNQYTKEHSEGESCFLSWAVFLEPFTTQTIGNKNVSLLLKVPIA